MKLGSLLSKREVSPFSEPCTAVEFVSFIYFPAHKERRQSSME